MFGMVRFVKEVSYGHPWGTSLFITQSHWVALEDLEYSVQWYLCILFNLEPLVTMNIYYSIVKCLTYLIVVEWLLNQPIRIHVLIIEVYI